MAKEKPILQVKTILLRKAKLRKQIKELEDELVKLRRRLEYGFVDRCPHPEQYRYHHWGQYERSRMECNLCGKELT